MAVIQELSSHLADLIAAGEVVELPFIRSQRAGGECN